MANSIVFLGTGGDSYVVGKQILSSGGIVLKIQDLQFHIDPGPGALVSAIQNKINPRANTAVLVSNNSLFQCNDVNAVIDAMTYGGRDKIGVLVANQTVVHGTGDVRPCLTNFHKSCIEKLLVLHAGQKVGIEDVEVHALPAIHFDPNAIGFKFLAPDFTLVYSSDTKYNKELILSYRGADILILNVTHPGEDKADYALNSETASKIIKAVNPKLAILTHFGIDMIKADPLYEGREIQKETGVQVLVAKEGMNIDPGSYAAKSNQKRLSGFKDHETGEVKEGVEFPEIPGGDS